MDTLCEQLVRRLYPALAAGNLDALRPLFAPSFEAHATAGLPLSIGGSYTGFDATWNGVWRVIGRAFNIRVEPEEWLDCGEGRLLVRGRYTGTSRATGLPLDAAFAHLWTAGDKSLLSLWHLTDSALWWRALDSEETT
ncbi:MAG: 2-(1,2-epoxy,2-dihydrophenyl)acetyl-CoA isomerase [Thermoleophilaceae bacterium]|jgi:2-(1,2-epoxy-1,2-dihydrophenyl)acetyl-CoA isomerase|nr:2-(1,2-epoxy,2-dihydrophenyl)acetyl-CoA isomerase [Thermoleophilaceae bacterium]